MGEKIKDLHTIRIGETPLMIELNEGYSSSQGRLIHIQNEKFRYLLREKDFFQLSSMVMRAWSEFEYIKSRPAEPKPESAFPQRKAVTELTTCKAEEIGALLCEIPYRLLDMQEGLITVLVRPDGLAAAEKALKNSGWAQRTHPYGKKAGYKFLYQMEPFRLFQKDGCGLEVFAQLPCASLTSRTWIPFDREIQRFLWADEGVTEGLRWANLPCRFIYHLCWAVFFNKGFSPYERQFISRNKDALSSEELRPLLKTVFFGYTDKLLERIEKLEYDRLIQDYFVFSDY